MASDPGPSRWRLLVGLVWWGAVAVVRGPVRLIMVPVLTVAGWVIVGAAVVAGAVLAAQALLPVISP